jgi:hypothetical protein
MGINGGSNGFLERPLVIYESAEKILAGADYHRAAPVGHAHYAGQQRQRYFSVYIYDFLINHNGKNSVCHICLFYGFIPDCKVVKYR